MFYRDMFYTVKHIEKHILITYAGYMLQYVYKNNHLYHKRMELWHLNTIKLSKEKYKGIASLNIFPTTLKTI